MHAQAESLALLTDTSLTDVILVLCTKGHFGIREAIAAAIRQEPRRLDSDPSDAATTGTFTLATRCKQGRDPLATPARSRVSQGN